MLAIAGTGYGLIGILVIVLRTDLLLHPASLVRRFRRHESCRYSSRPDGGAEVWPSAVSSGQQLQARRKKRMSETEPNEPPTPQEDTGDDGEDYGAKAGDDDLETELEDTQVPEAD